MDRVFPALTQTEMQLACMHVLQDVASTSEHAETAQLAPLQLPQASTISSARARSNGDTEMTDPLPDWLQQKDKLDDWMMQNLNNGKRRLKLVQALTNMAVPFQYAQSKVMQALGDMFSENVS